MRKKSPEMSSGEESPRRQGGEMTADQFFEFTQQSKEFVARLNELIGRRSVKIFTVEGAEETAEKFAVIDAQTGMPVYMVEKTTDHRGKPGTVRVIGVNTGEVVFFEDVGKLSQAASHFIPRRSEDQTKNKKLYGDILGES